jgi:hypothetical protein
MVMYAKDVSDFLFSRKEEYKPYWHKDRGKVAGRWGLKKVSSEEDNILYWTVQSNQGMTKIYFTDTTSPTNQSYVLQESQFASVSTTEYTE